VSHIIIQTDYNKHVLLNSTDTQRAMLHPSGTQQWIKKDEASSRCLW